MSKAIEIFRLNTPISTLSPGADTTNYEIQMDYSRNSGSGTADMLFYVKETPFLKAFETLDPNQYTNIVMFSQFGSPPGTYGANSGFEEWAFRPSKVYFNPRIPEPSTWAFLSITALAGFLKKRRQAKRDSDGVV